MDLGEGGAERMMRKGVSGDEGDGSSLPLGVSCIDACAFAFALSYTHSRVRSCGTLEVEQSSLGCG